MYLFVCLSLSHPDKACCIAFPTGVRLGGTAYLAIALDAIRYSCGLAADPFAFYRVKQRIYGD